MKYLRNCFGLFSLFLAPAMLAADIGRLDTSFSSNILTLHWSSVPGQIQQIQVSTNLINWSKLPPVLASVFTDSAWSDDGSLTGNPPNSQQLRFYRLLFQPQAFSQPAGSPVTFLPATAGLAYSWDFGDGTTSTSDNPSHTYLSDGTYTVTLLTTDASGLHTHTGTIRMEIPSQILLTPAVLASVRQKATNNTSQWQNFKQRLDNSLNKVIESGGAYQGDELSWIGDYALGYKVLQFQDPVTAAKYADKAIALMKSALQDFQKFGEYGQQYLARGDGSTKTFTLPHTNIVSSSLKVYTAPINVVSVTRSTTTNKSDSVGNYLTFIKVSNTPMARLIM